MIFDWFLMVLWPIYVLTFFMHVVANCECEHEGAFAGLLRAAKHLKCSVTLKCSVMLQCSVALKCSVMPNRQKTFCSLNPRSSSLSESLEGSSLQMRASGSRKTPPLSQPCEYMWICSRMFFLWTAWAKMEKDKYTIVDGSLRRISLKREKELQINILWPTTCQNF